MATAAKAAQGTLLRVHDGASTYNTILEMTSISPSGPTVDFADVTNHDSPSNYEEKLPTIIRSGQITFTGNWVPANAIQAQVRTDMNARTRRLFQIVYPTSPAKTHAFAGYFQSFVVGDATPTGTLTCNGTIEVDGPIVES